MFHPNTVFVLGAGASNEVGLPLGSELKRIIAKNLDFEFGSFGKPIHNQSTDAIYRCLREKYQSTIEDYIKAGWMIRDGVEQADSIDDFINHHQHDENIAVCGKIAIVQSILEEERKSNLKKITNNHIVLEKTWYRKFYSILTKEVIKSQLDKLFNNIIVISFNYDRCLEHYLVHAIAAHYFHFEIEPAMDVVNRLTILHPYGFVGQYFGDERIDFGTDKLPSADTIISSIRTYTEQIQDHHELNKIKKAVYEAKTIVFLGLAFHSNNMEILKSQGFTNKRFFATCEGQSENNKPIIIQRIHHSLFDTATTPSHNPKTYPEIFAKQCHDLFFEFGMFLSEG